MQREKSRIVFEKMQKVIPGGVSSPVRSFSHVGITPLIAKKGSGSRITDVDGNSYIDLCLSWGALMHGHAHPDIVQDIAGALCDGTTFGVSTEHEQRLAEKIVEIVPSVEQVRFVSTGTEATMSACRLARGYTNRPYIVKFSGCYHGHADQFLVKSGSGAFYINESSSSGIPSPFVSQTIVLPYNDEKMLEDLFEECGDKIAGVIVEPVAANMGVVVPSHAFLQKLRLLTQKFSSLLIFDEVVTGFRLNLQGAQGLFSIEPDLTCFGKIIGGGFPAAAFGGRKVFMQHLAPLGNVYQAGTLSGNPVAMRAGLKTIEMCQGNNFYEDLNSKVEKLVFNIEKFLKEHNVNACIQHVGSMFTLFFGVKKVSNSDDLERLDYDMFSRFFQYMFSLGIYIPPCQNESCFISSVHTNDDIEYIEKSMLNFFKRL